MNLLVPDRRVGIRVSRNSAWALAALFDCFSSHPLDLVHSVTQIVTLVLSGRGGDGNSVAIIDWG